MKITPLIQPRIGFHVANVNEFHFISRPWAVDSLLHPNKYAIVSKPDGSVSRVDYDSMAEYNAHKARIVASVAAHHSKHGKRAGCNCTFCQMEY